MRVTALANNWYCTLGIDNDEVADRQTPKFHLFITVIFLFLFHKIISEAASIYFQARYNILYLYPPHFISLIALES